MFAPSDALVKKSTIFSSSYLKILRVQLPPPTFQTYISKSSASFYHLVYFPTIVIHYDIETAFDHFIVCLGPLPHLSGSMFTCFAGRLCVREEKSDTSLKLSNDKKIDMFCLLYLICFIFCILTESFLIINISTLGTIINAFPPFLFHLHSLILQNKTHYYF